jgi:hypothetical protein
VIRYVPLILAVEVEDPNENVPDLLDNLDIGFGAADQPPYIHYVVFASGNTRVGEEVISVAVDFAASLAAVPK